MNQKLLPRHSSRVFNYRFFRASNRRVNASKSSSGGALYTGGGVCALPAGFPLVSTSSSVGGISGSLDVRSTPPDGPGVSEAFAPESGSGLPTFSLINS